MTTEQFFDIDGIQYRTRTGMHAALMFRVHKESGIPLEHVQTNHVFPFIKDKNGKTHQSIHGPFGRMKHKYKTQLEALQKFIQSEIVTNHSLPIRSEDLRVINTPPSSRKKPRTRKKKASTIPPEMQKDFEELKKVAVPIMKRWKFPSLCIVTKSNGSRKVQWLESQFIAGSYITKIGTWCEQKKSSGKCEYEPVD